MRQWRLERGGGGSIERRSVFEQRFDGASSVPNKVNQARLVGLFFWRALSKSLKTLRDIKRL